MRRPVAFTVLAMVLLAASLAGCAGSARQTESTTIDEEQIIEQRVETTVVAEEPAAERRTHDEYIAAERELKAAVEAGRITEEQAKQRLEEMRRHLAQLQFTDRGVRERDRIAVLEERLAMVEERLVEQTRRLQVQATEHELRVAVAAGEITEEQAKQRLEGMRRRLAQQQTSEQGGRERIAAAGRELRAAVEAGRITEEQARERMASMRERVAGMQERMGRQQSTEGDVRERYAAAARELRAAVEAGTITEEQARERMAGMQDRLDQAQTTERGMRERFAIAERELKAAVEAGEITEQQASERLARLRERIAAAMRDSGNRERLPQGREIALFNGRNLSGWEYFLTDETAAMEDVWSVKDGILVCTGDPRGYLATIEEYENYRLVVEWRWPEEPGNSGVLLRITGEPEMLPNCAEAQLRSGSAGDMYGFNGFTIGGDEERLSEISIGYSLPALEKNENEPGEWNRYDITVRGGTIRVMLNGTLVNEATGCDIRPGKIGLQSEGGVIHFRTVMLMPLRSR